MNFESDEYISIFPVCKLKKKPTLLHLCFFVEMDALVIYFKNDIYYREQMCSSWVYKQ